MILKTEKQTDKNLVYCIVLSLITALLSLGWDVISGGILTVRNDFNSQQIPFTILAGKTLLSSGLDNWCWNLDLGTSLINGFSFYNIGSPFFWISLIIQPKLFPPKLPK